MHCTLCILFNASYELCSMHCVICIVVIKLNSLHCVQWTDIVRYRAVIAAKSPEYKPTHVKPLPLI